MLSNTLIRRIEWGDCDPAGIVFNPRFFAFFDHGTAMLIEAAGWPMTRAVAEFGPIGWPLVATRATFSAPCATGEDVTITTRVVEARNSSFDIHHLLAKDGETRVEGFETRVWTLRDAATGRLRAAPLPAPLRARFLSQ
ncbi:acyl-CoA thioesterase [Amaricoccus solimangrovi]|uniref:Acyl-CoA thioesterase n=1 Tax=Amaricoccus solimangrovi TaxID=2589815 RepID=A0A501WJL3_9RHOB|nr:acyl-CoA thioesterase [Amaricoccus solimangrovi]TPE49548.1 acyl-CoA thioesterase [Amaricoccus solimangrovi]